MTAVHVADDPGAIARLREQLGRLAASTPFPRDVHLGIVESPYRALAQPLLGFIDELDAQDPRDTLTLSTHVKPRDAPLQFVERANLVGREGAIEEGEVVEQADVVASP